MTVERVEGGSIVVNNSQEQVGMNQMKVHQAPPDPASTPDSPQLPQDHTLMRTVAKRPVSLAKPQPSQLFLTLEDELRDARRVHSHGQEEDLRQALQMVINRVVELVSSMIPL